jgi:Tfp pilus assembly protein PilF
VKLVQARRGMSCAVLTAVLFATMGCSTAPKGKDAAAPSASQEKLAESLAAADKAQKTGNTEQALEQLEQAIKADPASKAPWLKKAQIHFDARQYGQAITEAQEVLQRDVNDLTAKSILAVSGLRVSAQALEQLRKANEVNGSARSEAESVAKIIREALGEPILVPAVGGDAAPKSRQRGVAAKPAVSVPSAPSAAPKPAAVSTPKPAAQASGGRSNPFGALQ